MNIFYLHEDPKICAKMHCDKHVVKMILEYAQLLSSVHHYYNTEFKNDLYKLTHKSHPCSIWARESKDNYVYLFNLLIALLYEYTARYNKIHKTSRLIEYLKKYS